MIVSATEFKTKIGKYLALVEEEDILITKNGKNVARLTSIRDCKLSAIRSLRGVLKDADMTLEDIREERLAKYESIN